jgi:hypothetical protein
LSDAGLKRLIDNVNGAFVDMFDDKQSCSEPIRAELKREGRQVLENSFAMATDFLPHIVDKYKLVV